MIELDPKLEETFKRRIPVDVDPNPTGIPENVLVIVDEIRDEEQQECEQQQQTQIQTGRGEDIGQGDLGTGDTGGDKEEIVVEAEVHGQVQDDDDDETKMAADILTSLSVGRQEGSVEDDDDGIERSNEDEEEMEVINV